jgi:hypothetical protein
MIYFVQAGENGPVKIGFTSSWGLRLSTLQTGNHEELRVRAIVAGDRDDEERMHEKFARTRIRGEWFEATPELMAMCREIGMTGLEAALPMAKRSMTKLDDDAEAGVAEEMKIESRNESQMINILVKEALAVRRARRAAA